MQISKKRLLIGILLIYTIAALCHLATSYNLIPFSPIFLAILRVGCIVPTIYYAWRKKSLTTWIMVSMIIGIEVGYDFPDVGIHLKVVSQIFLRLIKTIIAPLLFSTLALGIAGHSDMKQLGRLAWKSILYFEIVTTIALIIGLVAINLTQAGTGIALPTAENTEKISVQKQTWQDVVLHIFPENIAKAIAEGHILQIVVFSILFGIGLALVKPGPKHTMLKALESLSEVMFKFTSIVMHTAPFAVGAAIAYTVSHIGVGILLNLLNLLATLYLALAFLLLFVFVPIALFFKIPLKKFISAISEPVSLAFATTSSEAALPIAMEALEKKMGVPRKIVAFVMPMGYSFNLDGSTLYLSLASVFVAQAAGIPFSIEQQIIMVLTLMLTSKGVAGIPRATLVVLLGTAATFGLPIEPIFLILGIDELMDMARSAVNVIGNCLATMVIAKTEKPEAVELVGS